MTFDEWWDKLKEAGKEYADAHSQLTVYNEAQWHAREAAVAFGRMKYSDAWKHLEALEEKLEDPEVWQEYAAQVKLDEEGNPIPFRSVVKSWDDDWDFVIE